jgi:long-chain acyl-CoA synthetase
MSEKPWFKSYDPGLPHSLEPYPEISMLEALSEAARTRPDGEALLFKGRRMSYAELEAYSNAFAAGLESAGVKKGQVVMMLLPNTPQAVITQYGAWKAGAIICPVNPLYTEWELEHAIRECGAETVVVFNPYYNKVKTLQPLTSIKRVIAVHVKDFLPAPLALLFSLLKEKKEGYRIELQPGDYQMSDLLRQFAGQRSSVRVEPGDPAILLFSGGTTGAPKAVLGAHRSIVMSAMQLAAYAGQIANESDRMTLVMPLFHVYGNMGMNTAIIARWSMVIVPNPRDLDDLIATLRKTSPVMLHGVPTLFTALLNHPGVRAGKVNFKSIKVCYSAAAPLLAEVKREFEALTGGRLLEAYAMTETILAAVVCPTQGAYKEGSTGVPLPDVDVRIVDIDSGADLPTGEVGEVAIHAPQLMEGYWNRPDETAAILRDGWIYTGDVGYMDQDGYLFLIDRKKDLIKPSGFQVWPREVEEVIAMHPAVREVCVGGVPDPIQAEAVKAWVVLHPDQELSAKELQDFCRQKLSGYKVPRLIEFRATLPKTMVGKILRRELVGHEQE